MVRCSIVKTLRLQPTYTFIVKVIKFLCHYATILWQRLGMRKVKTEIFFVFAIELDESGKRRENLGMRFNDVLRVHFETFPSRDIVGGMLLELKITAEISLSTFIELFKHHVNSRLEAPCCRLFLTFDIET